MNEKIKELVEQAGFIVDNGKICAMKQDNTIEFEKFAELIVRECADQVDDYFCDFYNRTAAEQIKQHFGVEE